MASDEPAVKRVKLSEDEKSEETVDATVSSSEKLRYATVHLNLKKTSVSGPASLTQSPSAASKRRKFAFYKPQHVFS